jgi:cytolysin-activating lysine-acyltransferase
MPDNYSNSDALAALEEAKDGLSKLPILGPALWLFAKDPVKKYLFMADTDWALLPPVVLDQCRLYTKAGLPYAFITWAKVNATIDARLREGQPRIAPHEWRSGEHVWLIDVIAPFGQRDETLEEFRAAMFPDRKVCALLSESDKPGALKLFEWEPVETKKH